MASSSSSRRSLIVATGVLLLAGGVWGVVRLGGERGRAPGMSLSSPPASSTTAPAASFAQAAKSEEAVQQGEAQADAAPAPAAASVAPPVATPATPQRETVVTRPQVGTDGVVKLGAHSKRDPKLRLQGGHPRLQGKTHANRPGGKKLPARVKGSGKRRGGAGGN